MKILRWVTAAVFAVVLCLFLLFSWNEKVHGDRTYPQLTLSAPELEASIHVTDEQLLAGVTARDEKDGDLTERILIESVSKFIEPGVCKVTYAVSDNDCHVAKATQLLRYTDYTPPKFYFKTPMLFYEDETVNIREQIGAIDCLDGDISDRVTVVGTRYAGPASDRMNLSVQVTNSRGDMQYLDIPIYVEKSTNRGVDVELKEPLIYVEKGQTPDFDHQISGVSKDDKPIYQFDVRLSTNFDPNVPGVYSVHYFVSNQAGDEGQTVLTVIVEE